jgi:type III secretory pathway component EscS
MKQIGEVNAYYALLTSVIDGVCGHIYALVALSHLTAMFTVKYLLLVGACFFCTMKVEGELLTNYAVSHPRK